MAYCSNCGAYIPDGKTVCIACGSDSSIGKNTASAAFAKEKPGSSDASTSENLRRQLEEKQRRQKEQSAEWAKQAYSERRKEASGKNGADSKKNQSGKNPASSKKTFGKVLALLSYVSGFCVLPFILTPDDRFAKFHAKQGLILLAFSVVLDILSVISFPLIGVFSLVRFYLMIKGFINVLNDREEYLPVLGKYAEKF